MSSCRPWRLLATTWIIRPVKAVTIPRHGPPSVLEVRDYPDPKPGKGQMRIAVAAAGLNFAEVTARQGMYPDAPPPPCVVGYEVAGTVDQVGDGVDASRIGERVLAMCQFGGHASSVVVDEPFAFPMPDAMSFVHGAAIPVNYLTAHHMLFHIGQTHPGCSVLIHMAAGGVGTAVLQLLKTVEGVTSFGTASERKHEYLRGLGCTHPVDYRTLDYFAEINRLTDGRGVDIVLDPLGGPDWKKSWNLLAPAGRFVAFGFANMVSGEKRNLFNVISQAVRIPRFSPLGAMDHNRSMQGVNLGHLWSEVQVMRPQLRRLVELYEAGTVVPQIHAEIPFSKAVEAHELIHRGDNRGKVVLIPDGV